MIHMSLIMMILSCKKESKALFFQSSLYFSNISRSSRNRFAISRQMSNALSTALSNVGVNFCDRHTSYAIYKLKTTAPIHDTAIFCLPRIIKISSAMINPNSEANRIPPSLLQNSGNATARSVIVAVIQRVIRNACVLFLSQDLHIPAQPLIQ